MRLRRSILIKAASGNDLKGTFVKYLITQNNYYLKALISRTSRKNFMSQEPYNKNDRSNLPRFNNRPTGDDNTPRKGTRFSIYWIYSIIFALLILFQILNPFTIITV